MQSGIVVAGTLILDKHYQIPVYPSEGHLVRMKKVHEDVGGTGNISIDLAKLDSDLPVKISALIGKDENGACIRSLLGRFRNIQSDGIKNGAETPVTLVFDSLETKQRTFFYDPGSGNDYDESYVDWNMLTGKIFQLEYLLLLGTLDTADNEYGTHAARLLAYAQVKGMKTSVDMVSRKNDRTVDIVRSALKYTDYCTINELEASAATHISLIKNGHMVPVAVKAALSLLAEYGVSTWVIIHDAYESYGLDCRTGKSWRVPALKLPSDFIKGKTGAGDAFCAGVLYAAYKDQTIIQAMNLGTACASCSLSAVNGTDGVKDYGSVVAFSERYKGGCVYEEI